MERLLRKILKNKGGRVSLLKLGAIGALAIIFLCLGLRAGFKLGKSAFKEAQASPSGSWLSGYAYQKAILIDNTANSSALSDYQVKVTNPIYNETGLVGSWHFEEGAGTVITDSSGSGNNGTLTIGASGTQTTAAQAWSNGASGKFGGAISFDGTDDYVDN